MRARLRRVLAAVAQRGSGGRVLWHGPRDHRRIALTFDDGPDDLTPSYLEVLAELAVPATFFVMGDRLALRPAAMAAYRAAGHQVGSHGYVHQRFTRQWPRQLLTQLRRCDALMAPRHRAHARWVRPPHGTLSIVALTTLLAGGYTVGMWSHDSRDYDGAAAARIAERCGPDRVTSGDVILLHEGQAQTVAALRTLVPRLRDAGFELVTMENL